MAGKGGGAWKVAYADFVTAMMAFFMVMWLISQDQKVKESIARYFIDPVGFKVVGNKTSSGVSGAIFQSEFAGPIPGERNRSVGRGLGPTPKADPEADESAIMADWLIGDEGRHDYWLKQATQIQEDVSRRRTAMQPDQDQLIVKKLADQMRREVSLDVASVGNELAQDLLYESLLRVNWEVLAETCLEEVNQESKSLRGGQQ